MSKFESLDAGDCIRTNSGIYMNVFQCTQEMISIDDIAHALAHQCRFGGHLPVFYSVAQHSIECMMRAIGLENQLQALMHDASEAYLLDIPTPIKKHLSNYKEIENGLMEQIAIKFGFDWPMNEEIKRIDFEMLQFEWNHIMLEQPLDAPFKIMTSEEAKEAFLMCFQTLKQLQTKQKSEIEQ